MVAYLQKSEGSEGFHQIIDFLNVSHIQYALIENPTIYVSFIKQFWRTATARTSTNEEVELTATIDGQVKTITEASLRRHLKLEDNGGVTTLPNSEIFEQLALMGYKTDYDKLTFQKGHFSPQWRFLIHTILYCLSPKKTAWEQFSSNIATAIICLDTNKTFNFSKMIFDAMVKNMDSTHKFLMYPRFIQICLKMQKRHLQPHTRTYVAHSLINKVFSNMKRVSRGYSGCSLIRDKGSLSLHELTVLCTTLSKKVKGLESELKQTKQTYNAALTKLIKRAKKLEQTIKTSKARRRAKIVLSEDEDAEEDSSKQGMKIFAIDKDPTISLIRTSVDTEVLLEEEEPTELVEDQGSGEKSEKRVLGSLVTANKQLLLLRVRLLLKNLVYIRRSTKKRKDNGKGIITEPEPEKKTKLQQRQERGSLKAAIRLEEQFNEEESHRIAKDAEIARQLHGEINKAGQERVVAKDD
ncbi:hypothetical protein Tco_0471472 [Tanacetum coccineum]